MCTSMTDRSSGSKVEWDDIRFGGFRPTGDDEEKPAPSTFHGSIWRNTEREMYQLTSTLRCKHVQMDTESHV
jgi:hypothetical protein